MEPTPTEPTPGEPVERHTSFCIGRSVAPGALAPLGLVGYVYYRRGE
jgi:hypothetical protein